MHISGIVDKFFERESFMKSNHPGLTRPNFGMIIYSQLLIAVQSHATFAPDTLGPAILQLERGTPDLKTFQSRADDWYLGILRIQLANQMPDEFTSQEVRKLFQATRLGQVIWQRRMHRFSTR